MSAEVFSESLQYGQMKKRAVAARSFRVKIPSSNSTSFSAGETIQMDLPGNLAGQFYNFNQLYLKMTVTSNIAYKLDRCGAMGFIQRLQISTAGAQLADINNYNLLATALMDTEATAEWKAGYGNVLLGTIGDALTGADIGVGATTFCIPIVLNPLANTTPHRLIPAFALSAIQMRFTLASAQTACVAAAAPVLAFSGVEVVAMMTELSPGAMGQIESSTGGQYNILAQSWMSSGASMPGGAATGLTANLGFSVSSLERVLAIHRPSATVTAPAAYSLGNRSTADLLEYSYLINAEQYPARPVIVGDRGAEAMAEALISDHSLVDFKKGSTFNQGFVPVGTLGVGVTGLTGSAPDVDKAQPFMLAAPTGLTAGVQAAAANAATASDVGTYFAATEFENGLSDGKSSHIYSGISTIASTVQWRGVYARGAGALAVNIDFFANFTVLLSLNTRGSGVWSVSV
tara:strand:- start:1732 stop:3111 length:1380 start_codon:yes stop_codon:yes gene_type:complete